jgi:hypothetical protein
MINDISGGEASGGGHRVLAVVSCHVEQARAVKARFEAAGEQVETVWFANSRDLLARTGTASAPPFEAVILFADEAKDSEPTDAADLRAALEHTPLFQVSEA